MKQQLQLLLGKKLSPHTGWDRHFAKKNTFRGYLSGQDVNIRPSTQEYGLLRSEGYYSLRDEVNLRMLERVRL